MKYQFIPQTNFKTMIDVNSTAIIISSRLKLEKHDNYGFGKQKENGK